MLVERNIQYLNPEDIEIFSTSYLPNIVMKLDLAGSIIYLDFGTILYKNHSVVSRKTHAALVEQSSLLTELIEPLHEYFLDMLTKYSHASIKHYFKVIRNIIKDLYSTYENINLSEKNLALNLYQEYTQFLMIDRSTKLKKSIADMGIYNRKQNVLAEILSRSLKMNIQEIKNSYIEISSKHKSHNQPLAEDDFQLFFKANESIFLILNLILTTNMVSHLPLKFHLDSLNYQLIIEDFHNIQEQNTDQIKTIKRNKIKMINLAFAAFVNCFASVSAINFSQILTLTIDDLKNLDSSTKGVRVTSIKPRAGYKRIELSIPLKFKKLLNEFLSFRNWVKNNFNFLQREDLLFLGLNNPLAINQDNELISYSENQHNLYRKWFKTKFPEIKWIPVSNLRSTIANIYHNESKNTQVVAKKLGNTPQVVSTAYSEATEQQLFSEMTDAFQNIANTAPVMANTPIVVKVDIVNSLTTDMGHCSSKTPLLNSNYQNVDLEKPNCSNPVSCLFCENYVIHTDEEDIHKLLSAKKVFEMANSSQNSENIYLVIQKINDILDYLIQYNSKTKQEIFQISKLISKGKLTPFFEIMLNTLTDLGVDFYE